MKAGLKLQLVAASIVGITVSLGQAQEAEPTKEIENVIRDYLAAMAARDVQALRVVLDTNFIAIEAFRDARVHSVDTTSDKALLPPEGNKDWNKGQADAFVH